MNSELGRMVSAQKNIYNDLYTPDNAILTLLPYMDHMWNNVWECTDSGISRISFILMGAGYRVRSTSILTGYDFLAESGLPKNEFDAIITNPPYSEKDNFLAKCYEIGKPFALLLPTKAIGEMKRNALYRKYGISMIVPDIRFDFNGKGAPWFHTSWFVWNFPMGNNKLEFVSVV